MLEEISDLLAVFPLGVYFNPYFEPYPFKSYHWADITKIFTCVYIADQRNDC